MQEALPVPFEPVDAEVVGLVVSPAHRYDGRPGDGPRAPRGPEEVASVQVRASQGLVGDRYFGWRHRFAAVTFLAVESIDRLEGELGTGPFDPRDARRNVLTQGLDVESLVRTEFTLDTGHGPLRFRSLTRANPCAWMDTVLAPGAHRAMRGHAGIRCEPLDDGVLRVGPVRLLDVRPLADDEVAALRTERSAGR